MNDRNTKVIGCWRIGRIIPVLLAAALLLTTTMRFVPLDHLSFRPWEAMLHFRGPCGPFRSDASYTNERAYGDLAAMGNLPSARQYRREVFTTDSYGYRRNQQSQQAVDRSYRVLLLGDSMAVGSGVSDEQALSAQLEQRLGAGVYNAASPGNAYMNAAQTLALARRLRLFNGTVVYQYLGREPLPSVAELTRNTFANCEHWGAQGWHYFLEFSKVSPAEVFAQKVFKTLYNDVIFPNVFKANVLQSTLVSGESMLFFPLDVEAYRRRRSFDLDGLKFLADFLAKDGLKLMVLLTPDKYTVYEPLLQNADRDRQTQELFLDRLEKALVEAGIPVINLTGFMREKAREGLERGEYLYWRDDVHWNAKGIGLAADEMIRRNLLR